MLRKFLCVAAVVACSVQAHAGVLGSSMSFDGSPDLLNDDSAGVFIDTDNDGLADVIQGVINLGSSSLTQPDTINNVTGGNLYAAYSIALANTSNTPFPGGAVQTYAGSGAGAGFSVMDIVTSLGAPMGGVIGINDLTAPTGTVGDAALVLFTDNGGPATGLSAFENVAAANSAIDLEYSGSATEFDVVLVAGFDGVDDYYDITNTILGTGFSGSFDGAFSVLAHEFGAGVTFLDQADTGGRFGQILIATQQGDTTGGGTFTRSNAGDGFTFSDEAAFSVNAVPEPSSFLAFALLGAGGMVSRRRRNS